MPDLMDPDHLRSLAGGDTEVMRQVLDLFVSQAHRWSHALSASAGPDEVGEICHTIRGSATSIGAGALADLCADIENALAAGHDPGDRRDALVRLLGEVADQASRWIDGCGGSQHS